MRYDVIYIVLYIKQCEFFVLFYPYNKSNCVKSSKVITFNTIYLLSMRNP